MARARYTHLPRRNTLPLVKASALRKAKIIADDMTESWKSNAAASKRQVKLWHMRFPWNGGSWVHSSSAPIAAANARSCAFTTAA